MVGQIVNEDSPRLPQDDLSQVGEELQVVAKEARTRYWSSAVLEAANRIGAATDRIRVLAIPDEFVEHGGRGELLASLGLDAEGICTAARDLAAETADSEPSASVV